MLAFLTNPMKSSLKLLKPVMSVTEVAMVISEWIPLLKVQHTVVQHVVSVPGTNWLTKMTLSTLWQ